MSLNNIRNMLVSSIHLNCAILRRRHQRNINTRIQRRIQRQSRRIMNIIYRRRTDNTDTLNRISRLPFQITNDQFVNQMFNGSSF